MFVATINKTEDDATGAADREEDDGKHDPEVSILVIVPTFFSHGVF